MISSTSLQPVGNPPSTSDMLERHRQRLMAQEPWEFRVEIAELCGLIREGDTVAANLAIKRLERFVVTPSLPGATSLTDAQLEDIRFKRIDAFTMECDVIHAMRDAIAADRPLAPHQGMAEAPEGEAERRMDLASDCEINAFNCGWASAFAQSESASQRRTSVATSPESALQDARDAAMWRKLPDVIGLDYGWVVKDIERLMLADEAKEAKNELLPESAVVSLAPAPESESVETQEAARLDFLIDQVAFVVWNKRDGTTRQCQVWTRDGVEEDWYVMSGDGYFFNSPREAIDAAIAISASAAATRVKPAASAKSGEVREKTETSK